MSRIAHRRVAAALLACALSFAIAPRARAADRDPWFGPDKALHFGACFILSNGGYAGGDPSWRDFTWDVVGTTTGVLVGWLIDRYLF